jgi:iron complex outermembrane receptor protein
MASAAVVALAAPALAAAQEAPAAQEAVDEIVVTGTRLRASAPVGSALIGVTRDQISSSTSINATQLFQEVPQVLNIGVSDSSRGQSGGAANTSYSNSINIRGLGPYSTLTLIDGHRSVPQGSTGFAVDPSVIPTIAIQRLEIVADGASAIYGSDAVAGVANIILRRNVQGLQAMARVGDGRNYAERQFGAIGGFKWNSGQITVAAEQTYRDNVNGRDRDFFKADLRGDGGGDYSVTLCNPGNIVVSGVSYAIPAGGVTAANRSALVAGTSNRCDPFKSADLLPQQKRRSAVVTFDQELTDWLSVKADAFWTKRDFDIARNWLSSTLNVPRTNAFFVAPAGLTPASESVQYSFEGVYPQSRTYGSSKARQVHVGAEARLPGDWRLGADVTVGRNDERAVTAVVAQAARLTAALASSDPATAFNPFGGRTNPAVIADILSGINVNMGKTTFKDYQAQLDGGLFTLPGGEVRIALGYEGQRQTINPSNLDQAASAPRTRTKIRSRSVDSGFVEALVPIVGDANASPLIQRLELNIAGRYDHYDDVGSTWNPKIGLNWTPSTGLVIHGSYGTSFRAPTLSQLYGTGGGVLALFVQNYADPTCNCVRQGLASTGESPDIVPETARTFSLGFDWRPPQVSGLNVSLNLFDIKYKKQIQAYISDLSVLGREAQFAGTGVITRNPSPAFIADLVSKAEAVNGVVPNPVTLFVNGSALNTGRTVARGLDFQVGYNFALGQAGDVALNWSGAYFFDYKQSFGPQGPLLDILNTIYNPLRFRSRATGRWMKGPVEASVAVTYVNRYSNNLGAVVEKVSAYTPVDMRITYNLGNRFLAKGLKVSVDARNVFDIKPPFVNVAQNQNGGGGFDPTAADPTGRVVSLVLEAAF